MQNVVAASDPDISLSHPGTLPQTIVEGFKEDLSDRGVVVEVRENSFQPVAGVELYMATSVAIFIAGKYFDAILGALAERHLAKLKAWATAIARSPLPLQTIKPRSCQSPDETPEFSLCYSIVGSTSLGVKFKFLIRTEIQASETEVAVAAFVDTLRAIHSGTLSQEALDALLTYPSVGRTVLVTFDAKAGKIVPVDGLAHVRK